MREVDEIREALEKINVSTARGRRVLDKREIDIKPCNAQVASQASCRADGYIEVAKKLRTVVECDPVGIPEGELESVEFIMEQLEGLARRAQELYIRTY